MLVKIARVTKAQIKPANLTSVLLETLNTDVEQKKNYFLNIEFFVINGQ
jgi:hypothetical protein